MTPYNDLELGKNLVTKICLKFFNLEFQLYFREVKELKQFL